VFFSGGSAFYPTGKVLVLVVVVAALSRNSRKVPKMGLLVKVPPSGNF
jgi:hypothetical protein